MEYAICNLPIINIYDNSKKTFISQMFFGEEACVLEKENDMLYVEPLFGEFKGWIDSKQVVVVDEQLYDEIRVAEPIFCADLISKIIGKEELYRTRKIIFGAVVNNCSFLGYDFKGKEIKDCRFSLKEFISFYIETPYMKGGRTFLGIDDSALVQEFYRLNGICLPRFANEIYQYKNIYISDDFINANDGDIIFYKNIKTKELHCSLYIQDEMILCCFGFVRLGKITPEQKIIFGKDQEPIFEFYARGQIEL